MKKMPKDPPFCWPAAGIMIFAVIIGLLSSAIPDTDVESKLALRICAYIMISTSCIVSAIYYVGWVLFNKLCDVEERLGRKKRAPNPGAWERFSKLANELHDKDKELCDKD